MGHALLLALALGSVQDDPDRLIPLLASRESDVAWQAAYTLLQLDARDRVPKIVPLLKGPDNTLRPNVHHVLLRLGGREHAPLVVPFLDDPEPAVAVAAVELLGRFGARDHAGKILRFLEAHEPAHRRAAIGALAAMGARDKADKIAERLDDDQVLVRWEAVRALGHLRAREYAGAIAALGDEFGAQAPVIEALGRLGLRETAPRLLPYLDTPEPGIRWRAVRALADVDARDDAPRLAGMLHDLDSYVRLCALEALAALGATEQAGEMLELLRDLDPEVGKAAALESSALVTPEQIKGVLPLLGDEDGFVRWNALQLLVAADARGALPAIAERRPDRHVVWAIGRLGGRDHADKVAAALRGDDGPLRNQAAFALARISDRVEDLEAAERGASRLAAGIALIRLSRKDRASAAALLREVVVRREEPDAQGFPEELIDALAAGFEKEATAALAREVKASKRIESVRDLEALLSGAGVTLGPGGPSELKRRLPAGSSMSARRALEWSFGLRLVPDKGKVLVLDPDRALDHWKHRLAP